MITLLINEQPITSGTIEHCMDTANDLYNLTDEEYGSLQYDGSFYRQGVIVELGEDEE